LAEQGQLRLSDFDVIVVGSGFFGATIAERCAAQLDLKVCVLEKRSHIGGNCYSAVDDETGIEYHKYGTHIFHTNSEGTWKYINRFSRFTNYQHKVFTIHKGQVFPMPINLGTICSFFGRYFTPTEARELVTTQIGPLKTTSHLNLEDKAVSQIGRPLYEAFIRGYTKKQWDTDPRELPSEIISRLPVRYSLDDRYFSDRFQGMPEDGYTRIFERMMAHKNITCFLNVDYFDISVLLQPKQLLVYTGPIDRFFDYRYGLLGWRTIDLEREVAPVSDFQGTSVMNYADEDVPYTRVHEFKHLHPERAYKGNSTLVFREYARFAQEADEAYYPIACRNSKNTYDLYRAETKKYRNVLFGGRLGTYRYLDMHQAIGAALKDFDSFVCPFFETDKPAVSTLGF